MYPTQSGLSVISFLWEKNKNKHKLKVVTEYTDEFFFCLLGGYSIPFELNKSSFWILKNKGRFDINQNWTNTQHISNLIFEELIQKQFLPRTKDGSLRSYRFPQKKSKLIADAGKWLVDSCNFNLMELLSSIESTEGKRALIMKCPGFGYKTSSWFLRNIGQGHELAIIDVHLFRVLKDLKLIPPHLNVTNDYCEIEKYYIETCNIINANTDILDLVLWRWSRGDYIHNETLL